MGGDVASKIVISGASGLIGSQLRAALESAGYTVLQLVRNASAVNGEHAAHWDPARGQLDSQLLAGAEAVINLNGRNVGDGRWTTEVKQTLKSSRLLPTQTLVEAIREADPAPRLLINASAVGFYGDRDDEVLDEDSPAGEGFLAELTREWEATASAAKSAETRVVLLRLGMVVGRGGALSRMLTPFRLGLGGPIGSGSQWWPWVAAEDVTSVVRFALGNEEVAGALNVVSPELVRCRDFTRVLGRVLKRPAFLPLPAPAARLALGEMADALLLASARVHPTALENYGFRFRVAKLEEAIRRALG
jgi:uncharacterized protein (TIGR01777 family)